ncbi:MAG: hypothetical protein ABI583_03310 [Betaproteobacteria bacterium]
MALKRGTSQATVSSNIKTLVHEYDKNGNIGTSKPASRKMAVKQAVAIALETAGRNAISGTGKSTRAKADLRKT